jgi:tol-pal system protein YbgF
MTHRTSGAGGGAPGAGIWAGAVLAAAALCTVPACMPPQLLTLRSGLDSLRAVVDTLNVRDSITFQMLLETRRELTEQRDILLSTRAATGSTTNDLFEQMGRLEGKLDEVMGRFRQVTERAAAPPPAAGGPDPNQLYDQAAQDLTQGRYDMALQGFREFVRRFPSTELADNAQYGIGECHFARSHFDSAAVAYAELGEKFPHGDKAAAALFKLALSQEKLGQNRESRRSLEDLIRKFPLSGEAQLARERLGTTGR